MPSSRTRVRPGPSWSRRRVERLRQHLLAALVLALGLVPAAGSIAILTRASAAGAVAAPCPPRITHISKFRP
ncbi:MAG: hypothetical protein ABSE77_08120, partial [Acidimicrobiales bacterium]